MQSSCTYVASGEWILPAAFLTTFILGFGIMATSRGRQLVSELVNGADAPEAQTSVANA